MLRCQYEDDTMQTVFKIHYIIFELNLLLIY
jgi:hypothetical protein